MIIDHCRDERELFDLYSLRPMPNQYDFEFLMRNPNLFCFYDEKIGFLKGFITVQKEEIKELNNKKVLTLSGTSIRGIMPDVITAIITICNAFEEPIYSLTPLRHAGLVLIKAGFKKIGKNLYRRINHGEK